MNARGPLGRVITLGLFCLSAVVVLCQCRKAHERPPRCGDGLTEGREECDDGNKEPGDGCSAVCTLEGGEICGNYEDDDGDQVADCADTDCVNHTTCEEPLENCHNGLDDDDDQLADCQDPDCQPTSFCVGQEDCENGVDDDRDGQTDCDDSECEEHPLCGVCDPDFNLGTLVPEFEESWQLDPPQSGPPSVLRCPEGDGRDRQLRFVVDQPVHLEARLAAPAEEVWGLGLTKEEEPGVTCEVDELGCAVTQGGHAGLLAMGLPPGTYRLIVKAGPDGGAGPMSVSLKLLDGSVEMDCQDGQDEDRDGLTDCDDSDCASLAVCIPEVCNNGTDDDTDGDTDCDDSECTSHPACLPPEICDNGVDDDSDGLIDCADVECAGSPSCTGSDCVVNYDMGVLGRSDRVQYNFATWSATDDSVTSCGGGNAPEMVVSFTLEHLSTVLLDMTQSSSSYHVVALTTEDGTGTWCDDAEIACMDSGGDGRSIHQIFAQMPPARYFVIIEAATATDTGNGTLTLEVFDPLTEICDDAVDDDGDGLTDCDDPDCAAHLHCLPEVLCHDGTDDDGDGLTDCADLDCVGTPACVPGACVPDRDLGVVSALGPAYIVDSSESAPDNQHAECALGGGGSERVISFTLQTDTGVTLRLNQDPGSDHVVSLAVPAGPNSACDDAQHLCAEAGGAGLPIVVQMDELPAGTYYVLVDAFSPSGSGGFSLQVSLW